MYEQDDIDLLYVQRPHGWSELLLYVGGDVRRLMASHVFSDPPSDLIRLASQLRNRVPSMELLLWDEPGGHTLAFQRLPDRHHLYDVRLSSFPESWPDDRRTETMLLDFRVKADQFLRLIVAELGKVLLLFEDKQYRQDREFPYREFEALQQQLAK